MTDDELAKHLTSIAYIMECDHKDDWHSSHPAHLREAAARLRRDPAPPPPGSVEIRLAVALGDGSSHCAVIDQDVTDESQMDFVRSLVLDQAPRVLAEGIVTANIPATEIPVVQGIFKKFDPDETI